MKIDILSLFPDMFAPMRESIVLRAQDSGKVSIDIHNIRDFSTHSHKKVDDTPFGGGSGMVMTIQPIADALDSLITDETEVIYMSPRGSVWKQCYAENYSEKKHLIIICGHYEGIDQRIIDMYNVREISIGDYILTGGELAAMVMVDSIVRLVDGVISKDSISDESFSNNMLEYDQYTKPSIYKGYEVPEVLLSGHHANIKKWREQNSLDNTMRNRPDLLDE